MVKGTGWQQNNTYSGLLSLVTLSLSWYLARHEGLGLTGLWVGYGAYSAILTVVNYGILIFCVDWSETEGRCGHKSKKHRGKDEPKLQASQQKEPRFLLTMV